MGSVSFLHMKEISYLFSKELHSIKKVAVMLHKIYIANKCYSFPTISIFFLFILKTIMFPHTQKWSRTTVFNIHNNKWFWAPNQHIRIISERATCDTEDWSNGCFKFWFAITGIDYVLKYISRKTVMLNCNNLWQGSYRVWKSMKFDLSIFQVWKSMEKRKQSMEKYLCFQTFAPI